MGVAGAGRHEELDGAPEGLARAVVEVTLELGDGVLGAGVVVGSLLVAGVRNLGQRHAQHAGGVLVGALASPVAAGQDAIGARELVGGAQGCRDGGARRRHQLAVDGDRHELYPGGGAQVGHGGHGDGHHAVGAANGMAAGRVAPPPAPA